MEHCLYHVGVEVDESLDLVDDLALERGLHVGPEEGAAHGAEELRVVGTAVLVEGRLALAVPAVRVEAVDKLRVEAALAHLVKKYSFREV